MNMRCAIGCLVLTVAVTRRAGAQTPMTLTYADPDARSVGVAGEVAGGGMTPLTRDAAGKWSKTLFLRPGSYGYRFLVNGSKWTLDPNNQNKKKVGTTEYSVLTVGAPDAPAAETLAGPVKLAELVIEPMRPQVFEIPVSETAWKKAASLPRPDCDNA